MAIKIEINLTDKWLYSLALITFLLILGVAVYAYNSNGIGGYPSKFGHSVDEIDWSKQIQGVINVSGDVCAKGICLTKVSTNNTFVGCELENVVEGNLKYGSTHGFDDAGTDNDFYICCRDHKVIFFGIIAPGRNYNNHKCDEFGHRDDKAIGIPINSTI